MKARPRELSVVKRIILLYEYLTLSTTDFDDKISGVMLADSVILIASSRY